MNLEQFFQSFCRKPEVKIPDIESHFREHSATDKPIAAIRGLTDMNGELGESYLLSDAKLLHVHSRTVGADWVSLVVAPPCDLECVDESPYVFLKGTAASGRMAFKFSNYEKAAVSGLIESLAGAVRPEAAASEPAEQEEELESPSALTYFAAALHALAHADTIVEESESRYIRRTVGDETAVREGFLLWQKLGTEALIKDLVDIYSAEQRLCLIANIIELGMADGTLRSIEKETVRWFRDGLSIDKDSVAAIYDVLVVKNRIAVFVESENREG